MLAIGGDWLSAKKFAEDYLKIERYKGERDDMEYLFVRSHDYLLDFKAAASAYFQFSSSYPNHKRSDAALERAGTLAKGESNFCI